MDLTSGACLECFSLIHERLQDIVLLQELDVCWRAGLVAQDACEVSICQDNFIFVVGLFFFLLDLGLLFERLDICLARLVVLGSRSADILIIAIKAELRFITLVVLGSSTQVV